MLKKPAIIAFFATLFVVSTCNYEQDGWSPNPAMTTSGWDFNFPSSVQKPPPGWQGPVFNLSQDYPRAKPTPENYGWKEFDFKTQPREYLTAVLRYVYEGNIEVDWVVQKNPVRQWFHVPWLHAAEIQKGGKKGETCRDEKGREFIHGLTRERSTSLAELNFGKDEFKKECKNNIQSWAVSVYNPPGGFVIRQVWEEMTIRERPGSTRLPQPENFPKEGFPDGTVVTKLLFTAATPKEVPYLKNSPEWQADIHRGSKPPVKLRLLQVDVAVRDKRAEFDEKAKDQKASGWVFGTFVYDKDAPPVFEDGKDMTLRWRTLKPIGLMYGVEPKQTVLVDETVRQTQHLGCEDRLNGPIDNLTSSCLSCHALAEVSGGDKPFISLKYEKKRVYNQCSCVDFWFRNLSPGEALSDGAVSLHFSLQLRDGIARYCQFDPTNCPPDSERITRSGKEEPCEDKPPKKCPEKPEPQECLPTPTLPLAARPGASPDPDILRDRSIFMSEEISRGGDIEEFADGQQPERTQPKRKKPRRK